MSHPFLELHQHISWSKCTIEQAKIDIPAGIEQAKQSLKDLKNSPPSYENTIMGFELLLTPLYRGWSVLQHINSVNGTEESRNAIQELLPQIIAFSSELYVDKDLWLMIQSAEDSSNNISELQRKHIEETKVEFIKNGALLSDEDKQKLVGIDQELGKITQQYANNMLKDRLAFEKLISDEELLQGLPQSAKDAALQLAISKEYATKEDPKWLFTLDMPSYLPIQKFVDNAELRQEMFLAMLEVGRSEEHNNMPIVRSILQLRREKAHLLGYNNFPDMVLEKRMAQSGSKALAFVEELFEKSKTQFDKEVLQLQDYKRKYCKGEESTDLQPWDIVYYTRKMEQEYHQFNDELLRPYFALPKVMKGFCDLANDLYGIRIEEIKQEDLSTDGQTSFEVWHETVKAYEIYDADDSYIGRFYADFFPREGKRGGAWMHSLHNRVPGSPFQSQIGLICANVTPSLDGGSAQLNHREVQTVFHEMGHLLHHMLGEVNIPSLNGTSVAWDFVELPSQIMENWCWEKDFLQQFAIHSETNEVLSDEIFEKLSTKRTFLSAIMMMRQLQMGVMDLKLHLYDGDLDTLEIDDFIFNQTKDYSVPLKNYRRSNIARFPHLFSGPVAYASGYYSYKWAEVLDADAFSRFKKEGICSRDVGLSFRKEILSKGKSQSPELLFANFMGREPNPDALLKRDNLL